MKKTCRNRLKLSLLSAAALLFGIASAALPARAAEPIKIGTGMALTGGLAANGKAAILAMKIWEEEINAKGGLLGRPVQLIYYDDQSNPSTVPGIFTKLLEVDKVDLICGDYGTNLLAPAMPVVIQHNMTFFALFGLDVNREFQYPRYFAMQPAGGPNPSAAFSQGFFEIAAAQNPKPKTLAIMAADAEFPHNAADGARENAKKAGLQIVYDKTYPPNTTDYSPIVRAVDAVNADVVFSASYPPDANGIVNYDFWEPAKTLEFPGVEEFLKKYQAKAASEGVDPLGYYLPPFAYANLQVLQAAVEGTNSLDQDKLAGWLRKNTIKTIVGDLAFGSNGEWKEARVLQVQFHDVQGSDLDQWKTDAKQTILWPDKYATGKAAYPYSSAKK